MFNVAEQTMTKYMYYTSACASQATKYMYTKKMVFIISFSSAHLLFIVIYDMDFGSSNLLVHGVESLSMELL